MVKVLSPDLHLFSRLNRKLLGVYVILQESPGLIISLEKVIDRSYKTLSSVRVFPAKQAMLPLQ